MFTLKKPKLILTLSLIISFIAFTNQTLSNSHNIKEILELIQKDIKTLERAVYSEKNEITSENNSVYELDQNSEDVLTRHLLKLSEIENQFQSLTNRFEEINFKLDKLSKRLSKVQSDNQLRFQQIEKTVNSNISQQAAEITSLSDNDDKIQQTQSIESTSTILTENFVNSEEKILPDSKPEKQYEFATSFLKIGDYNTAERAFREFVITNPKHKLAGNAQYWYAETFRIRQLYTDAASAYLEGYQNYPKSDKAPINLLKLGVSLVQIGEKDQGCLMIKGVKKQYPDAKQSVIQKAKYEEKKFECKKEES